MEPPEEIGGMEKSTLEDKRLTLKSKHFHLKIAHRNELSSLKAKHDVRMEKKKLTVQD